MLCHSYTHSNVLLLCLCGQITMYRSSNWPPFVCMYALYLYVIPGKWFSGDARAYWFKLVRLTLKRHQVKWGAHVNWPSLPVPPTGTDVIEQRFITTSIIDRGDDFERNESRGTVFWHKTFRSQGTFFSCTKKQTNDLFCTIWSDLFFVQLKKFPLEPKHLVSKNCTTWFITLKIIPLSILGLSISPSIHTQESSHLDTDAQSWASSWSGMNQLEEEKLFTKALQRRGYPACFICRNTSL